MITAIDTSVLLAIFKGEAGADTWLDRLTAARRVGQLVICEIVYAELAVGFDSQASLDLQLERMGIIMVPIENRAAWIAGEVFKRYRQAGGPREFMIPDFLIASHAQVQADRLAAIDRGYLRRWFSELTLLGAAD